MVVSGDCWWSLFVVGDSRRWSVVVTGGCHLQWSLAVFDGYWGSQSWSVMVVGVGHWQ